MLCDIITLIGENMRKKSQINFIAQVSIYTALMCIFAQISIPTPPIPFTLSLLVIFIISIVLPLKISLVSVSLYIILGALGLPVFAMFRGGVSVLAGPTGGYIFAYPLMVLIIGLFSQIKKFRYLFNFVGMFIALVVCYLLGSLWFSFVMMVSLKEALILCVVPFIWFDIIKIILAGLVSPLIKKALFNLTIDYEEKFYKE